MIPLPSALLVRFSNSAWLNVAMPHWVGGNVLRKPYETGMDCLSSVRSRAGHTPGLTGKRTSREADSPAPITCRSAARTHRRIGKRIEQRLARRAADEQLTAQLSGSPD